jgi:hypothetical protein
MSCYVPALCASTRAKQASASLHFHEACPRPLLPASNRDMAGDCLTAQVAFGMRPREAQGGGRERENGPGDAREKAKGGSNHKTESTDAAVRADCLTVTNQASDAGGAQRAAHARGSGQSAREDPKISGRWQPSCGGTNPYKSRGVEVRLAGQYSKSASEAYTRPAAD